MTETLDPKARKAKYKKSLNLPSTSFPMRANLAQNEPATRKSWEETDLYGRLLEARADAPVFAFHDGPPFANGKIHVGHLLNKVLKDLVVRTRGFFGEKCHFVPGWDCHGLPIEHKVVEKLVESGKMEKLQGLDPDTRRMAIRRECQRYAEKFHKLQTEQMRRLLTFADYDEPYLTMAPRYEESVLEVFRGLLDQGLVYRDLKPVHWSIANRTALADAELEYQDREDPSSYVDFDAVDPVALAEVFGVDASVVGDRPALMIWTTTPWTLPANRLICVHEDFDYALVRLGMKSGTKSGTNGDAPRVTVVAKELLGRVAELAGETPEILAETKGAALVGLEYHRPLAPGEGRVVLGEHVTLEDGTGLVHTAPGHGEEDFEVGQREGIEVYCPVRGDGTYDDTVREDLRGLLVWEANPKIVETLESTGHLVHAFDFAHSYPHDWRSKTPVIFRCTEQWFIAVDKPTKRDGRSLRDLALEAARENLDFVPAWGENRLVGMLEARPDWCISRQRAWGLPIPAFQTAAGEVLLTAETVRVIGEVYGREGSDAWFQKTPEELLAGWDPAADPDAPDDCDVSKLQKMYDIFDVWLESGSSWHAVMRQREIGFPVKLYLEGSDQHRGWFQLSMLPALGVTGAPPYEALLTHGFIVDKEGKKMSKSVGNTLDVEDLLADHGADVLRWWVSSLAYENDVKVDPSFFDLAGESYRKVRNTLRFLLSNLHDFDPAEHAVALSSLEPTSIDAWVLSRLAELRAKVTEAYAGYRFRQAHLALFDFCNDTLSSFYLDATKDRLYCDLPDSPRRRSTQTVIHHLADTLTCLLAPILTHTAEEAHGVLHGDDAESVHLRTFPVVDPPALHAGWPAVLDLRARAKKALEAAKADGIENSFDAGLRVADPAGDLAAFEGDLPDLLGVSRVERVDDSGAAAIEVVDLRDEPRCERSWRRDSTVLERADGGMLSDRDARAVGLG